MQQYRPLKHYLKDLRTVTVEEFIDAANISKSLYFSEVRPTIPVIRVGKKKVVIALSVARQWMQNRTEIGVNYSSNHSDVEDEEEECYEEDDFDE